MPQFPSHYVLLLAIAPGGNHSLRSDIVISTGIDIKISAYITGFEFEILDPASIFTLFFHFRIPMSLSTITK